MRILHVSDCYPPRLGGIETQIAGLVHEQKKRGHDITVLTLTPGQTEESVQRLRPHLNNSVLIRFGSMRNIRAAYEEFKPAVIHAHVGSGAWLGWAAVRFAKAQGVPLVLSIHSVWGKLANFLYRKRLAASPTFRYVCVSQQSKESVTSRQPADVIANGLDVTEWTLDIPTSDNLTFITASRLVARKRLDELIKMFIRLHKKYPDQAFELRIAGEGPLEKAIRRQIDQQGVTSIKLLGRLATSELQREYARANAYIQLSRFEAFGLAAAEAQASGLPVIGLAVSGISDFVEHQVDGFLGGNDEEIERFLERAILEPQILQNLAKNINVIRKPYHWNRVLDSYDEIYTLVTGAR